MRGRAALLAAAMAALVSWIAVGAILADPYRVAAQTPAVQISRAQEARFFPAARDRPIFILAIGSDARPDEVVEERLADSIHLIGVNAAQGAASILGFPRDSYVPVPGLGQAKINEALRDGGPDVVAQAIQQLTGIPIDYWLLTSFDGITSLVDAIGGVMVEVPHAMNDPFSGASFEAGEQELDGAEALALARNRNDTPNSDFSRSENQGLILLGALEKLRAEFAEDPSVVFEWIAVGLANIQSDLSFDETFGLMLTAIRIDPQNVANAVVPGRIGMVGPQSVVFLSEDASSIYDDLGDDGILQNPPPPQNVR